MDPLQWMGAESGEKYAQIKHYLQVKNSFMDNGFIFRPEMAVLS